jgi:hypothetical protein|tara:strand:+ start:1067 stop:1984 length:918 start_codon:yes stop_codon:yes gene_type:complete
MNTLPNSLKKYSGKTTFIFGILIITIIGLTACNEDTDGGPLGPSNITTTSSLITVTPAAVTLEKNALVTFTGTGGSGTFTWSLDNTSLASIVLDTGVLTAGNTNGTVTVTATDTNGSTGTGVVSIADKTLTILPATAQVGRSGTQIFTVTGGTPTVFFSIDKATIATLSATVEDQVTTTLTAGINLGTAIVTATDSDGDTVTASVEVVANSVVFTPASATFAAVGTQAYTATGANADLTFTFTLSGFANSYIGASITEQVNTGTATVTIAAMPTKAEGNQTLTLTVTDSNGDTATSQLSLIAATA